jgi:hypothetical protein
MTFTHVWAMPLGTIPSVVGFLYSPFTGETTRSLDILKHKQYFLVSEK